LKQFIKTEWMRKGATSISLFHGGFKSSRSLNSYRPTLFLLTCHVDYFIASNSTKCLLCLHHCKISWCFVNNSYSTCQRRKHKCRMSTLRDIRPLYICNFLENRFCGHNTFVLQTIEILSKFGDWPTFGAYPRSRGGPRTECGEHADI